VSIFPKPRNTLDASRVRYLIDVSAVDVFEDEEGEEYGESNFGGFGDYFRRKKLKLQNLDAEIRSSSPNNLPIFKGVVAYVNGYTQPSLNDIHRMIVAYGGGFLQYLDNKTAATHIIASSLTPKKRDEFRKYRIVKPAWVVESIKAGRLLPWDSFRVIEEGPSQRVLKFGDGGRFTAEKRSQSSGYRDESQSSWYASQIRESAAVATTDEPALQGQEQPAESIRDEAGPPAAATQSWPNLRLRRRRDTKKMLRFWPLLLIRTRIRGPQCIRAVLL
jgi:DNA repair protein REV1